MVFRVIDEKKVLPKYLYYLLRQQAFFDWMMRSVTGMKMPRADKDNVMLYDVVIPDAPRQKKMLEIIKPKELTYKSNLEVINNYSDKKNQVLIEKLDLKEMTS